MSTERTEKCAQCGHQIWLSEYRPGDAAAGHGVWLTDENASSCVCRRADNEDGTFSLYPHVPEEAPHG